MTDNREELSKKERKRHAKMSKSNKQKEAKFRSAMFKGLAIAGAVALVIFVGYLIIDSASGKQVPGFLSTPAEQDWTKGTGEQARNILVEYSDFQCQTCVDYYPLVKKLGQAGHDLQIVYRHFPLVSIHKNAFPAAIAAEAAGKQGRFWEMHDLLFEHHPEWANLEQPNEAFIAYARQLDLDIGQFETDLDNREIRQKINSDIAAGKESGINSTPSFVLNGRLVSNPHTVAEFEDMLK